MNDILPCEDCVCYALCRSGLLKRIDEMSHDESDDDTHNESMYMLELTNSVLSYKCNLVDKHVTKIEHVPLDDPIDNLGSYQAVSIDLNRCMNVLNYLLKGTGIQFNVDMEGV